MNKKTEQISPSYMMQHKHTTGIVMVCVTRQRTCERLIALGKTAAEKSGLPLHVVHAVKTGENILGNVYEGEALEYLFTAAQLSGGELTVIRADNVLEALYEYALAHSAVAIVLGQSPQAAPEMGRGLMGRLQKALPDTEVIID
ncbi:hypothetical protein LJC42_05970 [Eubacteriales bacterium OttesenSCG-928-K08]|nr:hypothetical protein [Eubacteriales bacterium OttesenSCG-928-K08]